MVEFLFILFGLVGLCFIVLLTSIIKDYIVNKKSMKTQQRLTRKEAKELRDRLQNMGKPPWVRNYNKLTDKKNRK